MKGLRGVLGALALVLVLVVAAVLAVRVEHVHATYGEWRLSPSSSPPRLSFEDRDYHRGGRVAGVPDGEVVVGHVGSGKLYGPRDRAHVPTVLWLRAADGITDYSLAGGP